MPEHKGAYQQRRAELGEAMLASAGIDRSDVAARAAQAVKNYSFFGAPQAAVITSDRAFGPYGAPDFGGYLAHAAFCGREPAHRCRPSGFVGPPPLFVSSHFGLPADRFVVAGLSFGWDGRARPINPENGQPHNRGAPRRLRPLRRRTRELALETRSGARGKQ
jgi:hypothetical protein